MLDPVGFWSYGRLDDEHSGGRLSQLRKVVGDALNLQHGARVALFQDVEAIAFGADWAARIEHAIGQTTFYLPIVTPRFLKSENCHAEFRSFRQRMEALGYDDLIFPVHYVKVEEISVEDMVFGEDLDLLRRSQWIDFRPLRFIDPHSTEVLQWADVLASSILRTMQQHRVAEARERKRQEQAKRVAEEDRRREAERQAAEECERQEQIRHEADKRERDEAARRATEERQREQEADAKRAAAERERRGMAKREAEARERQEVEGKNAVAEPISDEQQAEPGRERHLLAKIVLGLALAISVALVSWFASRPNPIKLELMQLNPIKLGPIPDPIKPGLIRLDPIDSDSLKPELIKLCDRLAASPSDGDRSAYVAPVSFNAIDGSAAVKACRTAFEAASGQRRIIFQLGRAFEASKQFGEAKVYYEKAASLQSAAAMYNLARMYDNNGGLAQNYILARDWYEKAAALKDADAMYNLGVIYEIGREGIARDEAIARSWYEKAATRGNRLACKRLKNASSPNLSCTSIEIEDSYKRR